MCPKVRHLQYKVRRLQYKIRYLQVFAGTALYLYLLENILQMPEFVGQTAAFLCCSCLDLLGLVMAV
ncbi:MULTISPECIES: hypothetical protein [unclassified Microcoleus]|uniref:hypothetical protein n=1 Tax=unclassified Microcoleus TaxID=2642155 RepID=UPI002FD647C2